MKIIDERNAKKQNTHKKQKQKKQRQKRTRGDRSYSERVRAKLFCCAFKSQQNHLALTLSL